MKCMEAWAFGSMELWAGKLPDPASAVAAVGVAFSVYGFLFMAYFALSMSVCARSAALADMTSHMDACCPAMVLRHSCLGLGLNDCA